MNFSEQERQPRAVEKADPLPELRCQRLQAGSSKRLRSFRRRDLLLLQNEDLIAESTNQEDDLVVVVRIARRISLHVETFYQLLRFRVLPLQYRQLSVSLFQLLAVMFDITSRDLQGTVFFLQPPQR